jgi:hypothetical protein
MGHSPRTLLIVCATSRAHRMPSKPLTAHSALAALSTAHARVRLPGSFAPAARRPPARAARGRASARARLPAPWRLPSPAQQHQRLPPSQPHPPSPSLPFPGPGRASQVPLLRLLGACSTSPPTSSFQPASSPAQQDITLHHHIEAPSHSMPSTVCLAVGWPQLPQPPSQVPLLLQPGRSLYRRPLPARYSGTPPSLTPPDPPPSPPPSLVTQILSL